MFLFFSELTKAWNKELSKNREWNWPTKYSVICSDHFERHCFEDGPFLKAEMGIPVRQKFVLVKDAVPTRFTLPSQTVCSTVTLPTESSAEQITSPDYVSREREKE